MKKLLWVLALGVCALPASAVTVEFDWESGGTFIKAFPEGEMEAYRVTHPDPVYAGDWSLKLVDAAPTGTPQGYLAWIDGLQDGDIVTASFWRYDDTPGASPSSRIWAHYTAAGGTIDDYAGSAGGNNDYGPGEGWDQTGWTWVFDSNLGARGGLVIEVRTYSNPGDTVWIDNLSITAPDGVMIQLPEIPPQPWACCLYSGECVLAFEDECAEAGGVWHDGLTCEDVTCPAPMVCCIDHECFMLHEVDCLAQGGEPHPEFEDCTDNPCEELTPAEPSNWGAIKSLYR